MSKPSRRNTHRPGRNAPCQCGSGKKFKKCCGKTPPALPEISPEDLKFNFEKLQVLQKQRELQQGMGRPIISLEHKGQRFVLVGSKLYHSSKWKTFHDFLFDYIKDVLGSDWGNAEIKKPYEERHPIMQWYHLLCSFQQTNSVKEGEIYSASMTGAVAAYLRLAYNLYLIAHNQRIQERLIERLKDNKQFYGAYYETYVAATFIKAGFDLEFENEDDCSRTHCEFTATSRKTGNKYSVEAKSRQADKEHAIISNQLYSALKKKANHKRVVFIDVNVPDDADKIENLKWLREALESIRHKENTLIIEGASAPEAYVFITNYPCHYNLDSTHYGWAVVAEGFKIPDFKMDTEYSNIRDALRSREKHADMEQLIKSLKDHYEIPSTFDGEIQEFAFNCDKPRLIIGQKYIVPTAEGKEVVGELTDACVLEIEKIIYGTYKLMDGSLITVTSPLTDEELLAYRRYRDTFFGVYRKQGKNVESPLELFDSLFECYRNTSKERLLEFMKEHPNHGRLKKESQEELAIIFCERAVYSAMDKSDHK